MQTSSETSRVKPKDLDKNLHHLFKLYGINQTHEVRPSTTSMTVERLDLMTQNKAMYHFDPVLSQGQPRAKNHYYNQLISLHI